MKNKKKVLLFVVLFSILVIGGLVASNSPEDYTITEKTIFDISENTIYINITNNVGKDHYINLNHEFFNSELTDKIEYKTYEEKKQISKPIYGFVEKEINYASSKDKDKNNSKSTKKEKDYFDADDKLLNCKSIKNSKCVIDSYEQVGTKLVGEFKKEEKAKSKSKNNQKIINSQNGIFIEKGQTLEIKLTYSHVLAIGDSPTEQENKYNITVESTDGKYKTILDPTWWDAGWRVYREYTNLTGNITYMEINKTVDDNADWNDSRFLSCYTADLVFNHTLESKFETYGQFRVNNLGEDCTLRYYGNSEATSTSNASNTYFNPVAAYFLDQNANDFVGGYDGTLQNSPILTSGKINNSYDFESGDGDYIDIGDLGVGSWDDYTLSAWVKFDSWYTGANCAGTIVSFGGTSINSGILIEQYGTGSDGRLRLFVMSGTGDLQLVDYDADSNLNLDTWYHIVGTIDDSANKAELFINDVSVGTYATAFSIDKSTLYVGEIGAQRRYGPRRMFDGLIDEVLIYDKVLDTEQIKALYNQTAPNFIAGGENDLILNINSPSDSFQQIDNQTIDFDCNSTSINGVLNGTLYIDGIANYTLTNSTPLQNLSIQRTLNLDYGEHTWLCEFSSNKITSNSSSRSFSIDNFVQLLHPLNEEIIYFYDDLIFNGTVNSEIGETIENISLYKKEGGGVWELNETVPLGESFIYDEIDDSSINSSLWDATCTGTGGSTSCSISENTDAIGLSVSDSDDDFSPTATIQSNNFVLSADIENITLRVNLDGGGNSGSCASSNLYIFGTTLKSIGSCGGYVAPDDSVWKIVRNNSCGSNCFDVYDDGVYSTSINAGNSVIRVQSGASGLSGRTTWASSNIRYAYYDTLSQRKINWSFTKSISDGTIWNIEMCQSDGQCFMQDANWSVPFLTELPQTWTFINPQINRQTKWRNSLLTKIRGLSADTPASLGILADTMALPSTIEVTDSSGNVISHVFNSTTGFINWTGDVPGGDREELLSDYFNIQYYTDNITLTNLSEARLIGGNSNIVHLINVSSFSTRAITDTYAFFTFDDSSIVTNTFIKCENLTCTEDITNRDDVVFSDTDGDGAFDNVEWFVENLTNQSYELRNLIGSPIQTSQNKEILNSPIRAFDNVNWLNTISVYNPNTFEVETNLKLELPLGSSRINLDSISKNLQFDPNGLLEPYINIVDKNDPSHSSSIFLLPGETKDFELKYTTDSVTITSETEFPSIYRVGDQAEIVKVLRIKNQADDEVTDLEFPFSIDYAENLLVCDGEFKNGCPDEDSSTFDETNLDSKKTVKGQYVFKLDSIASDEVKLITLTYFVPTVEIESTQSGSRGVNGTILNFRKFVFESFAPFKLDDVRYVDSEIDFNNVVEARACSPDGLCEEILPVTKGTTIKLGTFDVGDKKEVFIWTIQNQTQVDQKGFSNIFQLGRELQLEQGTFLYYLLGLFADDNPDGSLSIHVGKIVFIVLVIIVVLWIVLAVLSWRRRGKKDLKNRNT